jgi:hypothetical protein
VNEESFFFSETRERECPKGSQNKRKQKEKLATHAIQKKKKEEERTQKPDTTEKRHQRELNRCQ